MTLQCQTGMIFSGPLMAIIRNRCLFYLFHSPIRIQVVLNRVRITHKASSSNVVELDQDIC